MTNPGTDAGDAALLNRGLHLAMEWGENWLQPIQARLGRECPHLTPRELDQYDTVCRAAMRYGHDLVADMVARQGENVDAAEWRATLLSRYPWVDRENAGHLFSQGLYYAWK